MSQELAAYIERLRTAQSDKIAARTLSIRSRIQAMEPIERFVGSLAAAGEIEYFEPMNENCGCAVLACSSVHSRLPSGGSLYVACTYAYPARSAGHVFWQTTVEASGRKPRFFSGTSDYRPILNYIVACIAEQRANASFE